jgi:hypothetical protein
MRLGLVLLLLLTPLVRAADTPDLEGVRFFETQVRPILEKNCLACHGPDKQKGNLRLDARDAVLKGGDSGPAVDLKNSDASLLLKAVGYQHELLRMPPKGPLPKEQVTVLRQWIARGVPHPSTLAGVTKNPMQNDGKDHWAFRSPVRPELPAVGDPGWCRNPIDRFILARLEKEKLTPTPEADRVTLLRRLSLTLTGLPPSFAEVEAFVKDASTDAYERQVDRLLASPAYGERWGRFWLDVARYADSNGLDENVAFGNAWRYRDEVIRAFNEDRPYDRFLVEQIAGDLLPAKNEAERRRQLISTGFLALGPKVLAEVDEVKMEMDILDEQIDSLGRAVLGLTLGCARCHDHKFDPLPTRDYYALAGIFRSTKVMEHYKKIAVWHENPLPGEPAFKGEPASALGMGERQTCDVKIHIRGSHLNLGENVPRGFPPVLTRAVAAPALPEKQSGRLELARWLTSPQHPLTARVFVNRIWRWTFGAGLVRTPDNFGRLGELPTHPELLDWLATEFVRQGWSIKSLHRQLVLSATFRQGSRGSSHAVEMDPDNHLWSRWSVRRIEAEAVRDGILAVSGGLDRKMGGSLVQVKNRAFFFDHTSKDTTRYDAPVRAVYLPVVRNHLYDLLQLFDFPDPATPSGDRASTSTAPQELFLLHGPLVVQAAERLGDEVWWTGTSSDDRTQRLYRAILSRSASLDELRAADALLSRLRGPLSAKQAQGALAQALLISSEFLSIP